MVTVSFYSVSTSEGIFWEWAGTESCIYIRISGCK